MIAKVSARAGLATLTVIWGVLLACGKVAGDEDAVDGDFDAGEDGGVALADAALWDARILEVEGIKRTDATSLVTDPATCSAHTQCDCDEDGFASLDCPVDAGSLLSARGTPLRPGDCDDLDPLRFPGQSYVVDPPPPGRDGDWNCDRFEEHWRESRVRGAACILEDRSCQVGFQGFMGRVACGALGDLAECQLAPQNPEGCGPVLVGIARQPCR